MKWQRWVLILCCLWLPLNAQAGTIGLEPGKNSYSVNSVAEVIEDERGHLTLADVLGGDAATRFAAPRKGLASFGFTRSAYWFRFAVENPSAEPRKMLLVLRTNWLDTVHFFTPDASGQYSVQLFGDTLPFKSRTYATPQFLIDLEIEPGTHTYFMRITSAQAFMTPIELWASEAFREDDRLWSAYYGVFYGILLVMVFYNGFIWIWTRDRNYFYYCAYLVAFFIMNFAYNGFAFQYFWPNSPDWSNWSHTPWIFLFQVVAILFAMSFLESKTRLPRMHLVLQAFLAALFVTWLVVAAFDAPVAYHAMPVYFVFFSTPLILVSGVIAWRGGYRAARFFVLATMFSLMGTLITALTAGGLLAYTFANFHAAEFGIMADVVLLSLALADRIKLLHEQQEAAEYVAMQQQLRIGEMLENANRNLENTVRERTLELALERDRAEAASQSKSRFLAAASHDLRQPLAAATLFIDALNHSGLNPQQASIVKNLDAAVKALRELLDALLNISRLDADAVEPHPVDVDCNDIFVQLESEFAVLAQQKALRFLLRWPQRKTIFRADPKLLTAILRNLIANAIRYTNRGGVLVAMRMRRQHVLFQVFDTGIGIAAHDMKKIFDEFYQVGNAQRDRTQGLGLGLSIALRLSRLLSYELNCRSRPGRGSVFELKVPLASRAAPTASVAQQTVEPHCADPLPPGLSVVIVEDDKLVADALCSWFAMNKADVMAFPDGAQALAHPAIGEADIYLSDLRLPGEVNGIELLDRIQAGAKRKIVGILITGDTSTEQVGRMAKATWPVLHKPVKGNELAAAIHAWLETPSLPAPQAAPHTA